jgi:LemA protein
MFPEIIYMLVLVLLVWMVYIYNKLVIDRNRVLTGWSDIDVQLKRRHDLIPNLAKVVKQYAGYEAATLQAVTELRSQVEKLNDVADISTMEIRLGDNIRKLLAVSESYPDLKADQSFLDLQYNLTDVENHIQYARRYYNGAVRNLNIRVQSFPDMLVARLFGFSPAQFFNFAETRQDK